MAFHSWSWMLLRSAQTMLFWQAATRSSVTAEAKQLVWFVLFIAVASDSVARDTDGRMDCAHTVCSRRPELRNSSEGTELAGPERQGFRSWKDIIQICSCSQVSWKGWRPYFSCSVVVKALYYKLEGLGSETRWGWIFLFTLSFRPTSALCVVSSLDVYTRWSISTKLRINNAIEVCSIVVLRVFLQSVTKWSTV
jgi:hypothetical protein